jgi:hypothetical protein
LTRHEFITRFEKEQSFFKKALFDPKKPEDSYPYNPSTAERVYKRWLTNVVDPGTEDYNVGREVKPETQTDGTEIFTQIEVTQPKDLVNAIYRVKVDDKEYLLSKGRLIGYNQFGQIIPAGDHKTTYPYGGNDSYPEMYIETKFNYEMELDEATSRVTNRLQGPGERIPHFLMLNTPENRKKLWDKRDPTKRCILAVKDSFNGEAKECLTFEMFDTKDFDYIKNMEFLDEKQKAEKLQEFETLQQNLISTRKK